MASNLNTRKSTVAALAAAVIFCTLFFTSLNTSSLALGIIYGGVLLSMGFSIYFWRREHRTNPKSSSIALLIVVAVVILFLLMFFILPLLATRGRS
jgi:predicted PurR-regulated permease PerM